MSVFNWCVVGQHDQCKRSYQRHIIDPRNNSVVWLDEEVHCQCRKRGCDCYIKPADRAKPKRKPRKRKS